MFGIAGGALCAPTVAPDFPGLRGGAAPGGAQSGEIRRCAQSGELSQALCDQRLTVTAAAPIRKSGNPVFQNDCYSFLSFPFYYFPSRSCFSGELTPNPAENRISGLTLAVFHDTVTTRMDMRQLIRSELERRGWSQRELCRRADMLPHQLCGYLNGTRDIRVKTLVRVLDVLELEVRPRRRRKGR